MAENRETTKKQGALMQRFAMHMRACKACQVHVLSKGKVGQACTTGGQIALEWLEFQAGTGDPQATMYLQGIGNAKDMT